MSTVLISEQAARQTLAFLVRLEKYQIGRALRERTLMNPDRMMMEDGSYLGCPPIGRAHMRRAWRQNAIEMIREARKTRQLIVGLRDDLNHHNTKQAA